MHYLHDAANDPVILLRGYPELNRSARAVIIFNAVFCKSIDAWICGTVALRHIQKVPELTEAVFFTHADSNRDIVLSLDTMLLFNRSIRSPTDRRSCYNFGSANYKSLANVLSRFLRTRGQASPPDNLGFVHWVDRNCD